MSKTKQQENVINFVPYQIGLLQNENNEAIKADILVRRTRLSQSNKLLIGVLIVLVVGHVLGEGSKEGPPPQKNYQNSNQSEYLSSHLQLPQQNLQTMSQIQVLRMFLNSQYPAMWDNPAWWIQWSGEDLCDDWIDTNCSDRDITAIGDKQGYNVKTSIPAEFSLLNKLKKIVFIWNSITGTIPPELSVLTELEEFSLEDNKIWGTVPVQLSAWQNIQILDLGSIRSPGLTGTLPVEFSVWQNLTIFDVGDAVFNDTFPVQYSAWTKISRISIYGGNMKGTFPVQYSTWRNVSGVLLGGNYIGSDNINSTLPVQYSMWTNISWVNFRGNNVYGTLPVQYSTWENVSGVTLDSNNLGGALPEQYSTWINVSDVTLDDNNLGGTLPEQYSTWINSSNINFEGNKLSGSVPEQYSVLKNFFLLGGQNQTYVCVSDYLGGLNFRTFAMPICQVSPGIKNSSRSSSSNLEAEALLQFKNSINDELLFNSWSGDDPCNKWRGIICNEQKKHVTSIQYSYQKDANTSIPPEFSNLKYLQNIMFNSAGITGTIPPELSALDALQVLQLNNNYLWGEIPSELSKWSKIKSIFLSFSDGSPNGLTGTLPSELSEWTSLHEFYLENNELNGTLPVQYTTWTNLETLKIDNNNFTGTVPEQYLLWNTSTEIYLKPKEHSNNLCISDYLAGLFLRSNQSLPIDIDEVRICEISCDTNISTNSSSNPEANALLQFKNSKQNDNLFISWRGDDPCNKWRGVICNKQNHVISIEYTYDYASTKESSIPPEFSNLKYLQKLLFYYARITGTIPPQLSTLNKILHFDIYFNRNAKFSNGNLPVQLSTWKNIQYFAAGGHLTGRLPIQFSEWRSLENFYVAYNALSGTLPVQFSMWYNISSISLYTNKFTGSVPQEYSTWSSITGLYLHQYVYPPVFCISKRLKNWFYNKKSVQSDLLKIADCYQNSTNSLNEINALLIYKNSISNPEILSSWKENKDPCISWKGVSCRLGKITDLPLYLYGDKEDFATSIPPEFSHLLDLQDFDFYGMTGTIPPELSTLKNLLSASFRFENYTMGATLPVELSTWEKIQSFYASNGVDGPLPAQYSAWGRIKIFGVDNNFLSGTLPPQYSVWYPKKIYMYDNNFSGTVPAEYSKWRQLEQLRLSPQNLDKLCISSSLVDLIYDNNNVIQRHPSFSSDVEELPKCG